MSEENMNQEFRLKKIDEIRNYLIEGINRNELMSKKHKKVCRVLKYVNHSLIVISTVTGCVFHFCFVFFSWNSNRNCKLYNRIKNLCNNRSI